MRESQDATTSTGYNYRVNGISSRFFSSRMMMNPVMAGFLTRVEPYFIEMLDSVKKLQFYQNYTIDKNDGSINS